MIHYNNNHKRSIKSCKVKKSRWTIRSSHSTTQRPSNYSRNNTFLSEDDSIIHNQYNYNDKSLEYSTISKDTIGTWRHLGAKEFRDRRKLAQRVREEQQQQQHKQEGGGILGKDSNSPFSGISFQQNQSLTFVQHDPTLAISTRKLQQDLLQNNSLSSLQQQGERGDGDTIRDLKNKQVILPHKKQVSLLELSTLFRVKIPTLLSTLSSLGEMVPILQSSKQQQRQPINRKKNRTSVKKKQALSLMTP